MQTEQASVTYTTSSAKRGTRVMLVHLGTWGHPGSPCVVLRECTWMYPPYGLSPSVLIKCLFFMAPAALLLGIDHRETLRGTHRRLCVSAASIVGRGLEPV